MAALTGAGCMGPAHAPMLVEREPWDLGPIKGVVLRTAHYRLHTTCTDPHLLDALPKVIEGSYAAYRDLLPAREPDSFPWTSFLFVNRSQWESYTKKRTGERANTYLRIRSGGYEENGVTVSHYSRRGPTLSVMAHEGLHQYLTMTNRRGLPAWLNEGLACQFEAFELNAEGWPTFDARKNMMRKRHLRETLRAGQLYKLPELLATDAGKALRSGEERSRTYYAQVWSLVLFLRDDSLSNVYHIGFERLLAELGTPQMIDLAARYRTAAAATDNMQISQEEAVFRYYITHDLETFAKKYEEFAGELVSP